MQRLEVSCAVRHIYIYIFMSLGAKGLNELTSCVEENHIYMCVVYILQKNGFSVSETSCR